MPMIKQWAIYSIYIKFLCCVLNLLIIIIWLNATSITFFMSTPHCFFIVRPWVINKIYFTFNLTIDAYKSKRMSPRTQCWFPLKRWKRLCRWGWITVYSNDIVVDVIVIYARIVSLLVTSMLININGCERKMYTII